MKAPGVAVAALGVVTLAAACGGGEATPTPTVVADTPTATIAAAATERPPTTIASPTPTPTATPPPEVELPNEPRETIVDRTLTVPPKPPSAFDVADPQDGSMRLYDIEAGTVTDYGPGSLGRFSPDSQYLLWTRLADDPETAELAVLDLETHEITALGPASLTVLRFGPEGPLAVLSERRRSTWTLSLLDLETQERRVLDTFTLDGSSGEAPPRILSLDERGVLVEVRPNLLLYDPATGEETVLEGVPGPQESVPGRQGSLALWSGPGPEGTNRYRIEDTTSGTSLLTLNASSAQFAGPQEIVAASAIAQTTPPAGEQTDDSEALVNLYLVDIDTARSTYVATFDAHAGWAFAANERFVVWAHEFCDFESGTIRFLDRASGEVVELNLHSWVKLAPAGLLGTGGGFGALALLDLDTLEWASVLPRSTGDVVWSPDYRYATTGVAGGHGGRCGS